MKRLLLLGLFMSSMFAMSAQDIIVKQDGETIKAYRTDIGNNAVYYRLENNDEAPVLTIPKSDVLIIKMQNGEKIIMDEADSTARKDNPDLDKGSIDYIPKYPSEPVADPEMIASVQIGSLIEFYDGSKGVVFYLNGEGHGLAVSLYQFSENWQNTISWYDCIDIEAIPNEKNTKMEMGLGGAYCNAAIKQLGLKNLPAIQWCHSIGPDWYLPSLGELNELLVVSNLSNGTEGPISHALKANGGDPIQDSFYYYSSSEDDNTNIFSMIGSGEIRIVKKYDLYPCLAIRMF